jgi:hypothetical protein
MYVSYIYYNHWDIFKSLLDIFKSLLDIFKSLLYIFKSLLDICKLRNNNTVFEKLEVSVVDSMVANAVLLATRCGAIKTDICDRQIHNWHRQLFKYSTVIPILMKFFQRVHTSLKTYK